MSDVVIIALISFAGTVLGTFSGIMASSKLTAYRIEQLEKKQEKYNNLVERTFKLEEWREAEAADMEHIKKKLFG